MAVQTASDPAHGGDDHATQAAECVRDVDATAGSGALGTSSARRRARYFDIGVNALDPQFGGCYHTSSSTPGDVATKRKHEADLSSVWRRSVEQGCDRWLITAGDLTDARKAWRLCRRFHIGGGIDGFGLQSAAHASEHGVELVSDANQLHAIADAAVAERRRAQGEWYATAGVHPTRATSVPIDTPAAEVFWRELVAEVQAGYAAGFVRAYGEFGLDYDRFSYAPKEAQLTVFRKQLELITTTPIDPALPLAADAGAGGGAGAGSGGRTIAQALPLFLHSRAASDDFRALLEEFLPLLPRRGVVHSFTGSLAEMRRLLAMGFHIGLNGCSLRAEESLEVVTALRSSVISGADGDSGGNSDSGGDGDSGGVGSGSRQAIGEESGFELPLERIMLETDAPWCEIRPSHAGAKYLPLLFAKPGPAPAQAAGKGKDKGKGKGKGGSGAEASGGGKGGKPAGKKAGAEAVNELQKQKQQPQAVQQEPTHNAALNGLSIGPERSAQSKNGTAAPSSEHKDKAALDEYLPPYTAVKKAEQHTMQQPVKGRNEPFAIAQVAFVLATARRARLDGIASAAADAASAAADTDPAGTKLVDTAPAGVRGRIGESEARVQLSSSEVAEAAYKSSCDMFCPTDAAS